MCKRTGKEYFTLSVRRREPYRRRKRRRRRRLPRPRDSAPLHRQRCRRRRDHLHCASDLHGASGAHIRQQVRELEQTPRGPQPVWVGERALQVGLGVEVPEVHVSLSPAKPLHHSATPRSCRLLLQPGTERPRQNFTGSHFIRRHSQSPVVEGQSTLVSLILGASEEHQKPFAPPEEDRHDASFGARLEGPLEEHAELADCRRDRVHRARRQHRNPQELAELCDGGAARHHGAPCEDLRRRGVCRQGQVLRQSRR